MGYSPPKKITVVVSFLLLALGFLLVISIFWIDDIWNVLQTITIPGLSSTELWVIIALVLIFLSWLLFFIGINYRGI
ncbi:MAG: hypothetical protein EU518_00710 [Promethearchaeota archaeon]|nr:MAG: hypothetical protein EU518_00710 [Candidatus Lokiarchaeota archaeon]